MLAIAASKGMKQKLIDITCAFTEATLSTSLNKETAIYMQQPEGFKVPTVDGEELVCRLDKSLYGLLQASREFFLLIKSILLDAGYIQLECDPCIFHSPDKEPLILSLYVDDLTVIYHEESQFVLR